MQEVLKGIVLELTCILFGIYATMVKSLELTQAVLAGSGVAGHLPLAFSPGVCWKDIVNGIMQSFSNGSIRGSDIINVDASGGFVENMNLATTQLRIPLGVELITIPQQ